MGNFVDDDDTPLDPETERELRDTMDQAGRDVREDGMLDTAKYIRRNYLIFRAQGFSRKQSFQMTSMLYQLMLMRGSHG